MNPSASTKPPVDSRAGGLLVVVAIMLARILLRWGGYKVWSAR